MELLLLVIIGTGLMVMWSKLRQLEDRLARLELDRPAAAAAEPPRPESWPIEAEAAPAPATPADATA